MSLRDHVIPRSINELEIFYAPRTWNMLAHQGRLPRCVGRGPDPVMFARIQNMFAPRTARPR
jgi:hypothetical protein